MTLVLSDKIIWKYQPGFRRNHQTNRWVVVCNMGLLKHFHPWNIFWSGVTETFCLLGHILVQGYWNILPPGVLKHVEPKFINILNYIKSLCIFFLLNCFKYFETFWLRKSDKKIHFSLKMFQYLHIAYYQHTLLQPLSKNRFYFFFLISWHTKLHHLLGCHAIGINSSLVFF